MPKHNDTKYKTLNLNLEDLPISPERKYEPKENKELYIYIEF